MVDIVLLIDHQGDWLPGEQRGRRMRRGLDDVSRLAEVDRVVAKRHDDLLDISAGKKMSVFALQDGPNHLAGQVAPQRLAAVETVVH